MRGDDQSSIFLDDGQAVLDSATVEVNDFDATPVCPRCLSETDPLDHYCHGCGYAVGRFVPLIPFVNIPFLCEPFCLMWERLWIPRGESVYRRVLYAFLLLTAGIVSGYGWIMLVVLPLWIWRRPKPPGHCANCGYDLRVSVDRCPECGATMSSDDCHGYGLPASC